MKFRLAARLEILALSTLGAAIAGCAGGSGYAITRVPAQTSIADARIPAERILAVAEEFEKQGNLNKAEELYAHVERANPELRADTEIRTRNVAHQRTYKGRAALQASSDRQTSSARQYAPVRRSIQVRQEVPDHAHLEDVSRTREPLRREAVRKPMSPRTRQVSQSMERPAAETWATLKIRVNDQQDDSVQTAPATASHASDFERTTTTRKEPDEELDGWKASQNQGVRALRAEVEENDGQHEAADDNGRPEEDKLISLLKSEDPNVRRTVALHISQLGPQAIDLLRPMRQALQREPVDRTRLQLAEAILRVSPREVEAFRILLKSAADQEGKNAVVARVMLSAHLARNPKLVESQSQLLLRDNDPGVRAAAQWNLAVADSLRPRGTPKVRQVSGIDETSRVRPALAIRPANSLE